MPAVRPSCGVVTLAVLAALAVGFGPPSLIDAQPKKDNDGLKQNRKLAAKLSEVRDEYKLPASHNVNSTVLGACPEIVARIRLRGDEFMGMDGPTLSGRIRSGTRTRLG